MRKALTFDWLPRVLPAWLSLVLTLPIALTIGLLAPSTMTPAAAFAVAEHVDVTSHTPPHAGGHAARAGQALAPQVLTTDVWENNDGYGDLWDRTSDDTFHSKLDNSTPMDEIDCSATGGWCLWRVPNGNCMEYNKAGADVVQAACDTSKTSQAWSVYYNGTADQVLNKYAAVCSGGYTQALTSNAPGAYAHMACPEDPHGTLTTSQTWTPYPA